jgi:heptosyltransferase-2
MADPQTSATTARTGERILVLRYRFIGDTLLTVPFLRNLRRAKPDAHIVWLVAPGSVDGVAGIPYVDELLYWDPATKHAESRGTHKSWRAKLAFIRDLRRQRFDRAYVLKRSLTSALIAFFSGARHRIGFGTEGRGLLLTKSVPYRHDQHEVQNFLDVLRADGVPVHDDHLEAWLSDSERRFADEFLARHGIGAAQRLIAIHPFATNKPRAWHEDNFAALASQLQREHAARVIIFGGPGDQADGETLRQRIHPAPVMAVGATTLRQTMALLERCELLVCNDSGIMHLGAAMQRPLVALFGPQSPVKFGPWGERCSVVTKRFPCSPCRQKFFQECEPSPRGKPACMESISVKEVVATITPLLADTPH